jgi:hypothetical protein
MRNKLIGEKALKRKPFGREAQVDFGRERKVRRQKKSRRPGR